MARRDTVKARGYCGIGIENCKTKLNLGTLWRSAVCLNADFMFVIGRRYERQATDTIGSWRHVPFYEYPSLEDFNGHRPKHAPLIGVELLAQAEPLEFFTHPEQAIYLLGPEDGSLSKRAVDLCQHIVSFSSSYCLNVASAGGIVLYDRQLKSMKQSKELPA